MRDQTLARLAAEVVHLLETKGVRAIRLFSTTEGRPLRHCGTPYRGGNHLALGAAAVVRGYTSPFWMTYRQASELGAQVRKGETASLVLKFGTVDREGEDGERDRFRYARAYPVFNASQIDGLPDRYHPTVRVNLAELDPEQDAACFMADRFVLNTGAKVGHTPLSPPCYIPSADRISMPPLGDFVSAPAYYATLLHELVHWTGTEARSPRTKGKRFGDAAYAMEELVAEIGAAMLCGDLGLSAEPREDHAHYLASWLTALRSDPKHLWSAGAAADRACVYLHSLQPGEQLLAA